MFGTAHMTGRPLAFAAITTLYLVIAIPWEERSLVRRFGEDYLRYTRQVRWRSSRSSIDQQLYRHVKRESSSSPPA